MRSSPELMLIKKNKLICIVSENSSEYDDLVSMLAEAGYTVEFTSRFSEAIRIFEKLIPAAILVDLEGEDHVFAEYCLSVKSDPTFNFTKIIFIAPHLAPDKEIDAFNAGADDFVSKPISTKAFYKRVLFRLDVESILPISIKSQNATIAKIYIDKESFTVYVNQLPVAVSRKEFELLHLMASHPGKIFTREEIFEKVWKRKANLKDRTLDVHILRLRKKLGDEFITTQKGVGYRFRSN